MVLTAWTRFYRQLWPIRDDVVIAPFGVVTTDLGTVIDAVNRRFGTTFARFDHTDANVEACFRSIEAQNAQRHGSIVETRVARPSQDRGALRNELMRALERSELAGLRARARDLYDLWVVAAHAQAS
jgi:hypothetical protein